MRATSFSSRFTGEIGQGLEGLEVVRSAVGIAGVIHGIDTKHQTISSFGFGQAEANGDKNSVASWHVGRGNRPVFDAITGNLLAQIRQRGAPPSGKVDGDAAGALRAIDLALLRLIFVQYPHGSYLLPT